MVPMIRRARRSMRCSASTAPTTVGTSTSVWSMMFAAASLTGVGQALGIVEYEERRVVVPTPIRIADGPTADIGLTATWPGQTASVALATITPH